MKRFLILLAASAVGTLAGYVVRAWRRTDFWPPSPPPMDPTRRQNQGQRWRWSSGGYWEAEPWD